MSEPIGGVGGKDREKNDDPPGNENKATPKQSNIKKIVSTFKAVTQELYRSRHEEHAERDFEHRWRKREVYGLWFAALVGVVAITVSSVDSHRQFEALSDQVLAVQAQQRPWVSIEPIPFDDFDTRRFKFAYLFIRARLKNVGHDVALGTAIRGDIVVLRLGESPIQEYRRVMDAQNHVCSRPYNADFGRRELIGRSIFPGSEIIESAEINSSVPFRKTDFQTGHDSGKRYISILLVGCVEYEFYSDGSHHQTRFSYRVGWRDPGFKPVAPRDPILMPQDIEDIALWNLPADVKIPAEQIRFNPYLWGNGYAD